MGPWRVTQPTHTPLLRLLCGEAGATPATAADRVADKRTLDEADFPDAKWLALDWPSAAPEIVD